MRWLLLIRWKNLAIVALTQLLVWYCLGDSASRLSFGIFMVLCGSTLFITAAGYIVNDIYDTEIDAINKPDRVFIGAAIAKTPAMLAYWLCNAAGLLLGSLCSYSTGKVMLAFVQAGCILLLWLYSAYLKRSFLAGNVAVAALSSLVVVVVLLYQPVIVATSPIAPGIVGYCYAAFAFIVTWLRELVKDMEDAPGDAAFGSRTLPVKYGTQTTSYFAYTLAGGILLLLGWVVAQLFLLHFIYLGAYITLLLLAPLSVWMVFFGKNNSPEHYHKAANWLKVIMLPGICSLIVYYLESQRFLCAR